MPPDEVNTKDEYLDPLVYRTFPGTTIKGALPRRVNPDYRNIPSRARRFLNWLFRKGEEPRVCNYEDCRKDIHYKTRWILISPNSYPFHYCSMKCLFNVWFGSDEH